MKYNYEQMAQVICSAMNKTYLDHKWCGMDLQEILKGFLEPTEPADLRQLSLFDEVPNDK